MVFRIRAHFVLFAIFAVSGFSGLIYESIWTHYLKLFLGHAAYAQTLVLAIFMGGLAIGSWLASRMSIRWSRLLLAYAAIEGIIGLAALFFHPLFHSLMLFSFESVIPSLGSAAGVQTFKWSLAALLIVPQSVLLGMTFPLMSSGLIRHRSETPGSHLALLYFTNSIGGAIGVLVSGFVLIPAVGLPGTMLTAGLLNIAVAIATWAVAKSLGEYTGTVVPQPLSGTTLQAETAQPSQYRALLVAAFVTGLASFFYEIGWIRMLTQVLGASTHAFELMLSSFIFGLAFGGLWIKRRIDKFENPVSTLALVQMVMAFLALATLFCYSHAFDAMEFTMSVFARSENGYAGFNVMSHLISMLIMVPTTFCAGMTLPLLTLTALKTGTGEKAIGGIYAANTVGAIIGVLGAVHLAMPLSGTKGTILIGAACDFSLGIGLLALVKPINFRKLAVATGIGFVGIIGSLVLAQFDQLRIASGVFRTGKAVEKREVEVPFLKDGKTATVSLQKYGTRIVLATNGKVDASLDLNREEAGAVDETVQSMLGILPLALHPQAKTAAVVGLGSGMTSQMLLSHPQLSRVDTIEIEPFMVEAARIGFSPHNALVFSDPRSHLHIEDAKTFFSTQQKRYDLIISEPSNPWVSGVASLFTQEYYQTVARHLEPNGLMVQWVQLYEIDFKQVASIFKALSSSFANYAVYAPDKGNILIVAKTNGSIGMPSGHVFDSPEIREEMRRLSIISRNDLIALRVADNQLIYPLIQTSGAPANSDYFPFVDNNAAMTRYLGSSSNDLSALSNAPLPIAPMLEGNRNGIEDRPFVPRKEYFTARSKAEYIQAMIVQDKIPSLPIAARRALVPLSYFGKSCAGDGFSSELDYLIPYVGMTLAGYLSAPSFKAGFDRLLPAKCRRYLSPTQLKWLELLSAVSERNPKSMVSIAETLLHDKDSIKDFDQFQYVLGAQVLGELALNSPERAKESFKRNAAELSKFKLPKSYYLKWLEAISMLPPGRQ